MPLKKWKIIISAAILLIFAVAIWRIFFTVNNVYHLGGIIKIEKGASLSQVSKKLKDSGVISSELPFNLVVRILNQQKKIKSGDYFFNDPVSVFSAAMRLIGGDFEVEPVKVVVKEGDDLNDIAKAFSGFEYFNQEEFFKLAKKSSPETLEGRLFPDTYLFLPSASAGDVLRAMNENFKSKAGSVEPDALIMASLIEKEVPDSAERKIVSGVLWKRLKIGMPLQVDAVFPYITGKTKVSLEDLKINSPYNTYSRKGLPPAPICNPGLDAIGAALNPQDSPYFYYLSGRDGQTHFAKTFEEHLSNKEKYLR